MSGGVTSRIILTLAEPAAALAELCAPPETVPPPVVPDEDGAAGAYVQSPSTWLMFRGAQQSLDLWPVFPQFLRLALAFAFALLILGLALDLEVVVALSLLGLALAALALSVLLALLVGVAADVAHIHWGWTLHACLTGQAKHVFCAPFRSDRLVLFDPSLQRLKRRLRAHHHLQLRPHTNRAGGKD